MAETRSPWTRPGFIAAAAVVALVVVAGLLIGMSGGGDQADTEPPPNPPAPPPGQAPVEALPTAIPTVAPEVTWELFAGAPVPVSATEGPRVSTDTTAAGYARSPEGALIAAVQLGVRAAHSSGRESWLPTITDQFVPGPDRDQLLDALEAAEGVQTEPGTLSTLIGYRYLSYTPDTAVIALVYRAPSSGQARYHQVTTTLRWLDGDWRMHAPPGGAWTAVNQPTNDLSGVVQWGAS